MIVLNKIKIYTRLSILFLRITLHKETTFIFKKSGSIIFTSFNFVSKNCIPNYYYFMIRQILFILIILYLVFFPNENFSKSARINNKKPIRIKFNWFSIKYIYESDSKILFLKKSILSNYFLKIYQISKKLL